MGIEPTLFAWEARVLPLNDTRDAVIVGFSRDRNSSFERRLRHTLKALYKTRLCFGASLAGSKLIIGANYFTRPRLRCGFKQPAP
jgi:hypothetical protein